MRSKATSEEPRSVCVMQPRLLPHLGYFALASRVDTFVLFDSAQYVRREWINRNRIRAANAEGWRWLRVPVRKAPRETPIREVEIADEPPWREALRRTLDHTYAGAPRWPEVLPDLDPLWERHDRLLDLIVPLLRRFAGCLDLAPEWLFASDLEEAPPPDDPQARILALCRRLGATTYWNLPGGRALYRPEAFEAEGISLRFVPELPIEALRRRFEAASLLSIVDILAFHTPGEAREMIAATFEGEA